MLNTAVLGCSSRKMNNISRVSVIWQKSLRSFCLAETIDYRNAGNLSARNAPDGPAIGPQTPGSELRKRKPGEPGDQYVRMPVVRTFRVRI